MTRLRLGSRGLLAALLIAGLGDACTSARNTLPVDAATGGAGGKDASTVTSDGSVDLAVDSGRDGGDVSIPACPTGQHTCPGGCVSDNDIQTCGASCTPCDAPTNGVATCDGKSCGGTCLNGQQLCHGRVRRCQRALRGRCPAGQHVVRKSLSVGRWTSKPAGPRARLVRSRPARPRRPATARSAISRAPPGITSAARAARSIPTRPRAEWLARPVRPTRTEPRSAWAATARSRARPVTTLCGGKCVSNTDVGSCGAIVLHRLRCSRPGAR